MIKAELFHRCFESGLASCPASSLLTRSRGAIPRYTFQAGATKLKLRFSVNGKASAIPYQPGEFRPELEAHNLRVDERDDGLVSWYQYTDTTMNETIANQRHAVFRKVEQQTSFEPEFWRQARDLRLITSKGLIDLPLAAGFPDTRLFYLDEADATRWGAIFGQQLEPWLARFRKSPMTLSEYMRNVVTHGEAQATRPPEPLDNLDIVY